MANYTLEEETINNTVYLRDSVTANQQNNTITIPAGGKYVSADIQIEIKVTKAILTSDAGSNSFEIEIPNGPGQTVTLHFNVDSNSNTTIT